MCGQSCPQEALDADAKDHRHGPLCILRELCERISRRVRVHELYSRLCRGRGGKSASDHRGRAFRTWPPIRNEAILKNYSAARSNFRQVSAAGCNACEADLNVLATPFFDLARFGINFVASPRHADGIVVTAPSPAT